MTLRATNKAFEGGGGGAAMASSSMNGSYKSPVLGGPLSTAAFGGGLRSASQVEGGQGVAHEVVFLEPSGRASFFQRNTGGFVRVEVFYDFGQGALIMKGKDTISVLLKRPLRLRHRRLQKLYLLL